ncbi:MAG: methylated-DNA--[protein]-cysteine S-methyltransferase [Geminicoccaceae bacterium]
MTGISSTMFDTAIGSCGIAWSEHGVVGVQLPESGPSATRARLARRFPGAADVSPPPEITRVIDALAALLAGQRTNLDHVGLDLTGVPPFASSVYAVARTIRPGGTLTYGSIADQIGAPGAAREVGEALGRNPFPLIVPCHRVIAAGGKLGGFSANGGAATKRRLLAIEQARAGSGPDLFDALGGRG